MNAYRDLKPDLCDTGIKNEKKVNTKIKELAKIIKHYILKFNGKYYKQKLDRVFK